MSWELLSEFDWAEEYSAFRGASYRDDDLPAPNINAWHTEMAEAVPAKAELTPRTSRAAITC